MISSTSAKVENADGNFRAREAKFGEMALN
jgi:hypothetical protein